MGTVNFQSGQRTVIKRKGEIFGKLDVQGKPPLNDFRMGFAYSFDAPNVLPKAPAIVEQRRPRHECSPRAYVLGERFRVAQFMEARRRHGDEWPPSPLSPREPSPDARANGQAYESTFDDSGDEHSLPGIESDAGQHSDVVGHEENEEEEGAARFSMADASLAAAQATLRSLEQQLEQLRRADENLRQARSRFAAHDHAPWRNRTCCKILRPLSAGPPPDG